MSTTGEWPPKEAEKPDTALVVNKGVEQPPIINPYIKTFLRKSHLCYL
jgi:hypothetical protein